MRPASPSRRTLPTSVRSAASGALLLGLLTRAACAAPPVARAGGEPGPARAPVEELFVAADVTIPVAMATASLYSSGAGEPRVVLFGQGTRVLLPSPRGWLERPVPRGIVAPGADDLTVLLQPSRGGGGRLVLQGGRWTSRPSLPLPGGATGPASVDATGRATVFGAAPTGPAVWIEGERGWQQRALAPSSVIGAWSEPSGVYAVTSVGVQGSATLRQTLAGVSGLPAGGLDRSASPALAWHAPDGVRVLHAGGVATSPLPRAVRPPQEQCVRSPCEAITYLPSFAWGHGVLARPDGLWVPHVLTSLHERITCVPESGPMHPCDPGGRGASCPPPERWRCGGPREPRDALRVLHVEGASAREVRLPQLAWASSGALRLTATAADPAGRLHLLLQHTSGDASRTHYVVLSDHAESYPLPTQAAPPEPVQLAALDEVALGLAGFAAEQDVTGGSPPPAYVGGEARTGGPGAGPGWWTADLGAPSGRRVVLSVALVAAPAACGSPGLSLTYGAAALTVAITATGLDVTAPGGAPSTIALARPPETLRLELDASSGSVVADGVVVARTAGTGAATASGTATFGDMARCGGAAQTATRWRSVHLER